MYRLGVGAARVGKVVVVVLLPLAVISFLVLYGVASRTWDAVFAFEGPVEWVQAGLFGLAGVFFAAAAVRRDVANKLRILLFAAAIFSFFALAEELSWGQHLIGFESPAWWADANQQGEVNIHNLKGVQRYRHFSYLIAAGLGFAWMFGAARGDRLRQSRMAPVLAQRYFGIAFGVMVLAFLFREWMYLQPGLERSSGKIFVAAARFTEVGELAIAAAAFAYASATLVACFDATTRS